MKSMRMGGVLAVGCLTVLLMGCGKDKVIDPNPPGTTDVTGSIEGTVTDSLNAAIEGAAITANPTGATATTGPDGHYVLPDLAAGAYTIQASASGYRIDRATVQVTAGQTARVQHQAHRLPTTPATGTIEGVLMNAAANLPLAGALVSTIPATRTGVSAGDGSYRLSDIPVGTYRIVASLTGFAIDTVDVAISVGQLTRVRPAARRVELEGNDTFMQANPLALPDAVDASLAAGGDTQDWFRVAAPSNGRVTVRVQNLMRAGTAAATLGKVAFLSEDQTELAHQNGSSTGAGGAESLAPVPVAAGQTYFVVVNRSGNQVAGYRVTLAFEAEANADSGEPNDARSQATSLGENASVVALIGYAGDVEDWYVIVPGTTGTLTVQVYDLQPTGVVHGLVGEVELLDKTLHRLAHNNGGATGPGGRESMSAAVAANGTYYVHVARNGNLDAAPYRLEVVRD